MSLLDLLMAEDVTTFNDTRGERSKVDLFAADLAEKNLKTVDLSGADVDKADLTGSDLTQAGLYKARMNGIDGTGMKLIDCLGARVKLREAWLEEADLSGSDFANADLSEAVLTRTTAKGLRIAEGKLKAADLTDANWTDCNLMSAHLSKAILTNTDLSRSDLTEAAGGEIQATGARFDAVVASRARIPGGDFTGASFVGAKLDGANLAEGNFTNANLMNADLTGANLTGAILTGATLTGCVLAEASLDNVDLTGMDLTDVDLTGLDADLLGLSDEQRDAVLAIGIPLNPDAIVRPDKVKAACNGDLVAGVWTNDDGEGLQTVRWFARTSKQVVNGILPVLATRVLSARSVACGDGVALVLLQERPGGITVDTYQISPEGKLVGSSTGPLGYDPMVAPVVTPHGDSFRLYGIARRGPTFVVSGQGEEGFGPMGSKPMPTARGFLGHSAPFLLCKGNVLTPVEKGRVASPVRAPGDGFPGKFPTTVRDGGRWLTAWVLPPQGKHPGGIRAAWLGTRGMPEVIEVAHNGAVLSMDVVADDAGVWIAAVVLHGLGETRLELHQIGGSSKLVPLDDVDRVGFALGPENQVVMMATTDGESMTMFDMAGKKLGSLTA